MQLFNVLIQSRFNNKYTNAIGLQFVKLLSCCNMSLISMAGFLWGSTGHTVHGTEHTGISFASLAN